MSAGFEACKRPKIVLVLVLEKGGEFIRYLITQRPEWEPDFAPS